MNPDKRIKIWAEVGSVSCAHLTKRARDCRHVVMFGQQWTALRSGREDGGWWFELCAYPTPDGDVIMCPECGSFDLDKPDGVQWECGVCPWREPVPDGAWE